MGEQDFAAWLLQEIEARGWSQRYVGEKGGVSGVAVSKVLSGEIKPGIRFVRAMARALGVSVDEVAARAGLMPQQVDMPPRLKALTRRLMALPLDGREGALDMLESAIRVAERAAGIRIGSEDGA